MGKEFYRKPSHEGDALKRGYESCPQPSEFAVSQGKADHISPEKAEGDYLDYPDKTAPGSNRAGEEKGSV